jgi:hypothetical protein
VEQLQQLPKLFQAHSGVPNNSGHREGIDWIVAGNRQDSRSIRHDNVRALAENTEASFFQCSDGSKMVDPWKLGHELPQQCGIIHPLPCCIRQVATPSKLLH